MPKATRKNSTKSKTPPREGLALIDATRQRKMAREPDLKRELKPLRHSNDVTLWWRCMMHIWPRPTQSKRLRIGLAGKASTFSKANLAGSS